jgi:hypothetical protein
MTSPHRTVATLPIRTLDVQAEEGAPHFIAAASGLVRIGQRLYVVADDALHLACFTDGHAAPGTCVRLLDGDLPLDAKARKTAKPDFECLMALPAFGGHTGGAYPNGALLAIGSGSKESRCAWLLLKIVLTGLTARLSAANARNRQSLPNAEASRSCRLRPKCHPQHR